MAEFAQQLLTEHPKEAARVFSPLVSLFEEVLDEATAAKAIRAAGLRHGPIVGIVLEVIMFNTFSSTIGGVSLRPTRATRPRTCGTSILHGIGTDAPA